MKAKIIRLASFLLIILLLSLQNAGIARNEAAHLENSSRQSEDLLARCLAEKGLVVYSSITCSACRAQRKLFGKAFEHITEIECNPNAPDNQVGLCLEKQIRKTLTWILEVNGKEIKRLEGYHLLEDLATFAGCDF